MYHSKIFGWLKKNVYMNILYFCEVHNKHYNYYIMYLRKQSFFVFVIVYLTFVNIIIMFT